MSNETKSLFALWALLAALAALFVIRSAHAGSNGDSVLSCLTRTPPHWSDRDEPSAERLERMRPVSQAVETVTKDPDERAALLAILHHEGMLARYVLEDRCEDGPRGKDECDEGKARGGFQLHREVCPAVWEMGPSSERLKLEASCALEVYREALKRCWRIHRVAYAGGLSGYRGSCRTGDSTLRARTFEVYRSALVDGWPSAPRGWVRVRDPQRQDRRKALSLMASKRVQAGEWFTIRDGVAALAEWHWHDFGGEARPRGWHVGLSLYEVKR